jgi:hypothetical protein
MSKLLGITNLVRSVSRMEVKGFQYGSSRLFATTGLKMTAGHELGEKISPTNFQRKILVWGKLYPSLQEIPDRVSPTKVRIAWDKFRVRVCIWMVILAFVGCGIEIIRGRHMRNIGDSLSYRTEMQIQEWQQKGREEKEAKRLAEEQQTK